MDTLSLNNYLTALPKQIISLAEKTQVRECDEVEKGQFVAYVDEGADSYDVAVKFNSKKEVTSHSCDCTATVDFCQHKCALLVFVASNSKVKVKVVKAAGKKSKIDTLLDDADHEDLKIWLKAQFKKSKDLELSFLNNFEAKDVTYTPDSIAALIATTLKAVVGRKRKVDASQAKKLTTLLIETVKPIVEHYHGNMMDASAYQNYRTLQQEFTRVEMWLTGTGGRLDKYLEKLSTDTAVRVTNLVDDDGWREAIGHYVETLYSSNEAYPPEILHFFAELLAGEAPTRNKYIAEQLVIARKVGKHKGRSNFVDFDLLLMEWLRKVGLFEKHYELFTKVDYYTAYNLSLMEHLMEIGKTEQAIQVAQSQVVIGQPSYRQLLKDIYTQMGDPRLYDVLMDLVPTTMDFAQYQQVVAHVPKAIVEPWERQLMKDVQRYATTGDRRAIQFEWKVLDAKDNYNAMINKIRETTPYAVILTYFEKMVAHDKRGLLDALFGKIERGMWYEGVSVDVEQNVPRLANLMRNHYTDEDFAAELKNAQKKYKHITLNYLFKLLVKVV